MPMWHRFGRDTEAIAGRKLDRAVLRRVWSFARAYRGMLWLFLVTIVLSSLFGILPPLVFKRIIDEAIPNDDLGQVNRLAALSLGLAVSQAALNVAGRWYSARIGEGLIFDLRSALYDHVQRMPLGFFTRTQTGALISRMNNDVVGAQQALTGTLGGILSNTMDLTFTFGAMVALEWRLTLLALVVVPAFLVPAKFVGRRL
jgi:ATP-binding cassette, subfamily B, bacterial